MRTFKKQTVGLVLALLVTCNLLGQIITTVAGGSSNVLDGSLASNAVIYDPQGITIDKNGNIYIVDYSNHRVRKITASTGIISTVAGNGTVGFSGDGGLAINAQLYGPNSIAVDTAANIFITEYPGNRIRRIDAQSNIITTIAGNGTSGFSGDGGLATNASLFNPMAVAVSKNGDIYFVDRNNYRIRKVNVVTGIITTVTGNGTRGFSGDNDLAVNATITESYSIAIDSLNNIFFADNGNRRVRKISGLTGVITTIAGTGTFGYTGDNGLAVNARLSVPNSIFINNSGDLLIADNNVVRRVAASTGIITTIIGNGGSGYVGDGGIATSAQFNSIQSVTGDTLNNYYLIDPWVKVIRKVNAATNIINTIVGNPLAAFGDGGAAVNAHTISPQSIAIDESGNLLIAEYGTNRIRKVSSSTDNISTVVATGMYGFSGDGSNAMSSQIKNPYCVRQDRQGNIYFSDINNNRIRKVDYLNGNISTIAGTGISGNSGDGGLATNAQISNTRSMVLDSLGDIYMVDFFNNRIRKITAATGIITTIAGAGPSLPVASTGDGFLATSAQLSSPNGIAIDKVGNIYLSESTGNKIRKIDKSTGIITTIAGNGTRGYSGDGGLATNAQISNPGSITLDSSENVYFCDIANDCVRKISKSTGFISTVVGIGGQSGYSADNILATNAKLAFIRDLAFDKAGNLYIAEGFNNRIRKVSGVGILPLKLLSFIAQSQNNTIYLSWQTSNEVNVSHFTIQRSVDGSSFSEIGKVIANGDGSYSYTDNQLPSATVVYYRLQMVDKDGSFTYSKVVSCKLADASKTLAVYPNPVKDHLFVQITSTKAEKITLQITDLQGKLLQQEDTQVAVGSVSLSVNTSTLAKGSYILLVKGSSGVQQKQFVKE